MDERTDPGTIAERADFGLIRYAQVWEDADVLLGGLRIQPGGTVYSVASAGDNTLALLTADPARVIAFDLSAPQLACLRLRIAAYRALDHAALLELMGSRPSQRRGELLDAVLGALTAEDRAFWEPLRADIVRHGLGGIGKFERYFRYFRRFVLPLVHGRRTCRALVQPRPEPERHVFYRERWNSWRWRKMQRLFFSRFVMGRLGRDPAFFAHAEGSLADQVARRTEQALTEQDPSQNPYLHWILFGTHGEALPTALRPEHFETIRDRLDRVEIRHAALEELGRTGPKGDAFNLSNIFEYMPEEDFRQAFAIIEDLAADGARSVHWNMMVPRHLPPETRFTRDEAAEAELGPQDRAFFYRQVIVAEAG